VLAAAALRRASSSSAAIGQSGDNESPHDTALAHHDLFVEADAMRRLDAVIADARLAGFDRLRSQRSRLVDARGPKPFVEANARRRDGLFSVA
jgi:hypothetical protein